MRDTSDPDVAGYIEAENRYAEEAMRHTTELRERLVAEMLARVPEAEVSVPVKRGAYEYYTRATRDLQYPVHCRRMVFGDATEEVLLDQNALSEGHGFFAVSSVRPSPDNALLAYSVDLDGSERLGIRVKDLVSGRMLDDLLDDCDTFEWCNDSCGIYYVAFDEDHRPYKVLMHRLGTAQSEDTVLYHEQDPRFEYMALGKSKGDRYVTVTVTSMRTSQVFVLDTTRADAGFVPLLPRKHGVKHFAVLAEDAFYIITDDGAPNYALIAVPAPGSGPGRPVTVLPNREDVAIDVSDPYPWVDVFRRHIVVFEREGGLGRINVIDRATLQAHTIGLPDRLCWLTPMDNPDYDSEEFMFSYSTPVTPRTVYRYDMSTRRLTVVKRSEVPGFDPAAYESSMTWATARDGTRLPVVLVHRRGLVRDGMNPLYLYGYGAYGDFEGTAPELDTDYLSLLDRGFVLAKAMVRGGGELGGAWHRKGAVLDKMNTFTDFIACAEHLVAEGYTSKDRLVARGRSAGGLLMGAVANLGPDLFKAIVAEVAFVDAINTMLDETLPSVPGEREEFGDPTIEEHYRSYKRFSPYDNVGTKAYPNMLITTGVNDPRVAYWEPLKWAARLRAARTDDDLLLMVTRAAEGHMGASGRHDHAEQTAFMFAFMLDRLGVQR